MPASSARDVRTRRSPHGMRDARAPKSAARAARAGRSAGARRGVPRAAAARAVVSIARQARGQIARDARLWPDVDRAVAAVFVRGRVIVAASRSRVPTLAAEQMLG